MSPPLDCLQQSLQRQLDMLQSGDIKSAESCMPEIQQSLSSLSGKVTQADLQQAKEIARLYRQVALALEIRKDEVSRQLAKLRQGRGLVKVYGSGAGH